MTTPRAGALSRNFMNKYGANVAGFFWNAGTAAQFVFGLIALSPLQIASSLFNVASPCTYMFLGHKNWGVPLGGTLGIIGTFLAVYAQIAHGEIGSIFGFTAFVFFVSFGNFSAPLHRRFAHSKNALAQVTLGHPRRISGLGSFTFTRLPIIYECVTHGRWPLAIVFALWALGDLAFSFSKPHQK